MIKNGKMVKNGKKKSRNGQQSSKMIKKKRDKNLSDDALV